MVGGSLCVKCPERANSETPSGDVDVTGGRDVLRSTGLPWEGVLIMS